MFKRFKKKFTMPENKQTNVVIVKSKGDDIPVKLLRGLVKVKDLDGKIVSINHPERIKVLSEKIVYKEFNPIIKTESENLFKEIVENKDEYKIVFMNDIFNLFDLSKTKDFKDEMLFVYSVKDVKNIENINRYIYIDVDELVSLPLTQKMSRINEIRKQFKFTKILKGIKLF